MPSHRSHNASEQTPQSLGTADLEMNTGAAPRSRRFNDTYFDKNDGLSESRHVFLDGCDMTQMWRNRATFVIGETGFGTGLNFLAAWQLWADARQKYERLHFISVEGFPLTPDQLREVSSSWPELKPLAGQLSAAYPDPQPGFHRMEFDGGRVVLTLLLGPVAPMLEQLDAAVDAWFLDGFAPDRNPEMWSPDVLQQVARLSRLGARLATFTVAGQVRRTLEEVGFRLEKRPGFGKKREVLSGVFKGPTRHPLQEPWYRPPANSPGQRCDVAIIGSGLAGAAAAHTFGKRGHKITVIEAGPQIASGASATPAAVLMPRLTADLSIDGQFYALAWRACLALLRDVEAAGFDIGRDPCGSLRLAESAAEAQRQAAIMETGLLPGSLASPLNATEAATVAGLPLTLPLTHGGLFFPHGGTVSPQRLCAALLKDARVILNRPCTQLIRQDDKWSIQDGAGEFASADIVVLANGLVSTTFQQARWLPVTARLGQVTRVAATDASKALRCVFAGEGYVTPPEAGHHIIGATFDHISDTALSAGVPAPTAEADHRNLTLVQDLAPGLLENSKVRESGSWTGVRCTTPDHLPIAGALPDYDAYLDDFAELRHGHRWSQYPDARYHPGLGILTGLGAHGVITAPLAAELLASQLLGEPSPLPRAVANGLHPGRFIVRDLKRRRS